MSSNVTGILSLVISGKILISTADKRVTMAASVLTIKDDPAFAKYFKMLKLGLPPSVVKHKMTMETIQSMWQSISAPLPQQRSALD